MTEAERRSYIVEESLECRPKKAEILLNRFETPSVIFGLI